MSLLIKIVIALAYFGGRFGFLLLAVNCLINHAEKTWGLAAGAFIIATLLYKIEPVVMEWFDNKL